MGRRETGLTESFCIYDSILKRLCDSSDGIATIMKRRNRLREVGDLPKVTQKTGGGARSGLISDSALYCGM